jgi:predicted metal-dependent hydrolase
MCAQSFTFFEDPEAVPALPEEDQLVLEAIWIAAIVTYVRCFNGGARTRLAESHVRTATAPDAEKALRAHRYLLELRDRHIAHPVSAFEEGYVALVVEPRDPVGQRLKEVQWSVMRQTMNPGSFQALCSLASALYDHVGELMVKAAYRLLTEAETLTSDQLSSLPDLRIDPAPEADLAATRGAGGLHAPDAGEHPYVTSKLYAANGEKRPNLLAPRFPSAGNERA